MSVGLCEKLRNQELSSRADNLEAGDVAELRWGIGLIGRHSKRASDQDDFGAACHWAAEYGLPFREDA